MSDSGMQNKISDMVNDSNNAELFPSPVAQETAMSKENAETREKQLSYEIPEELRDAIGKAVNAFREKKFMCIAPGMMDASKVYMEGVANKVVWQFMQFYTGMPNFVATLGEQMVSFGFNVDSEELQRISRAVFYYLPNTLVRIGACSSLVHLEAIDSFDEEELDKKIRVCYNASEWMFDVVAPAIKVMKLRFNQKGSSIASSLVLYSKDPKVTQQLIDYCKKVYLPSHHILKRLFSEQFLNWKFYVYFCSFTSIYRRYVGVREIVVYDVSQNKFFSTCPMRCLNLTLPSFKTIAGYIPKPTWWKKCFNYICKNRIVKLCLKILGVVILLHAIYLFYCWCTDTEPIDVNEYLWHVLDYLNYFDKITEV